MMYVMKFGVRNILQHAEEATSEMHTAHRYYNDLMRVELDSRAHYRQMRLKFAPGLDEAEKEVERLNEEIEALMVSVRLARKDASKPVPGGKAKPARLPLSSEQKVALAALKEERKEANARAKKLRASFEAMIASGREEFDARTSGAPRELLAQIREIGGQLKEAKRTRGNPDVAKLKRALEALKERKKAIAPKTHAKAAANERVTQEMLAEPEWHGAWKEAHQLERDKHSRCLELRAECGLTHGTYVAVEDAVQQALKTAKGDPGFRSWDIKGGCKIGRQMKKGTFASDVLEGKSNDLRITDRVSLRGRKDETLRVERSPKSKRNFAEYALAGFPIGKGTERKWVSAEVFLHRPIPPDAQVRWVYLVPRRVGLQTRYTLQLTVETEKPLIQRPVGTGEALVKLRWSGIPADEEGAKLGGIVVADINGGSFAMDGRAYAGMAYAKYLRGISDKVFDAARSTLVDWASKNAAPEWLTAAMKPQPKTETSRGYGGIGQWRNHGRLAVIARDWIEKTIGHQQAKKLWKQWRADRDEIGADYFDADPANVSGWAADHDVPETAHMALWLEWWRRKDMHLVQWSGDTDRKARAHRKNQYRVQAARMSERFERVVVEDFDLSQAARRKTTEQEGSELHKSARYQRTCASPSEFVDALKLAFGPDRFEKRKRERPGDGGIPGTARKEEKQEETSHESVQQGEAAE